jgi:hypothetical protein
MQNTKKNIKKKAGRKSYSTSNEKNLINKVRKVKTFITVEKSKWKKEEALKLLRDLADLNELEGLNKFIEILENLNFFDSKKRIFPKYILSLYRFLMLIEEVSEYSLSTKLGYIFPSNSFFVKRINFCNRTISRYLLVLEQLGFIERKTFFNISNDFKFHSFRKIKLVNKREIPKYVNIKKNAIVKFVDKKYFLGKKEKYFFFKSLYEKFERTYRSIRKKPCPPGKNPYLYEYGNPFGATRKSNDYDRLYEYPIVKIEKKF